MENQFHDLLLKIVCRRFPDADCRKFGLNLTFFFYTLGLLPGNKMKLRKKSQAKVFAGGYGSDRPET